jgi:3-isopropylmalate/(R)-2-methylmalate dehydratase small subunit
MKKNIRGLAYVVGDAIDTDQIIPAEHLVYSMTIPDERRMYGRYAMSGVPADSQGLPDGNHPFTSSDSYESAYSIIIAGSNFGCGSSREHAPFALQVAGCEAVVAESYARIFYRNSVDGGFLIPYESRVRLIDQIKTGDELEIDTSVGSILNISDGKEYLLNPLGDIADILDAGNVFEYARKAGLMPDSA